MLAAERYSKVSLGRPAHERMEDVLTSHVFSLFRYFNHLHLQADFLRRAVNLQKDHLPLDSLRSAQVEFWPRFSLGAVHREADVLLLLEEESSETFALVVEAKHESGLHNLAGETTEDEGSFISSGHQLGDEYAALSSGVWHLPEDVSRAFSRARRRLLLYVTSHYQLPIADLEEAVKAADGTGTGTGIYWVSWRELHTLLVSAGIAGFLGYSLGERNFLEDLRDVLARRRLRDFQPFQGLNPVSAYERMVQRPLRFERLLPVQPFHSIFGLLGHGHA